MAYKLTRRLRPAFDEPPPASIAARTESFRLTTRDGQELGAWFVAGDSNRPVVLLLHGNGGCRGTCLRQVELLTEAGCGVMLISFRAHGDSTGERNDFGYSAQHDVVAAVEWLTSRAGDRPVVVWGQSLGAAAALFAADELGPRVVGYILECPYQDLYTAVQNRLNHRLPPVLSSVAYAGLNVVAPLVLPNAEAISPLSAAEKVPVGVPVLVLAGGADLRASVAESEAICQTCGDRARLVVFDEGDHLRLLDADEAAYRGAVLEFVESLAGEMADNVGGKAVR